MGSEYWQTADKTCFFIDVYVQVYKINHKKSLNCQSLQRHGKMLAGWIHSVCESQSAAWACLPARLRNTDTDRHWVASSSSIQSSNTNQSNNTYSLPSLAAGGSEVRSGPPRGLNLSLVLPLYSPATVLPHARWQSLSSSSRKLASVLRG
jgi:hypothetical protein